MSQNIAMEIAHGIFRNNAIRVFKLEKGKLGATEQVPDHAI